MNNLNKKLCDEWNINKNINPLTKRTIKVNGAVYNNIGKNCSRININKPNRIDKEDKTDRKTKNICDMWLNNPNINPETGKSIKKNGPIYKKLFKLCDEKKVKSKSKSDSSSNISSNTKKLCRNWLDNPTINPETGRKIKIDGPKYNYFKSLCLNVDKKAKSSSYYTPRVSSFTPLSSSKFHSILSNQLSPLDKSKSKSKSKSFQSVKSSLSSMNDDELKKLFDKDKKLKQSVFTKLKKLDKIKKSSSKSSSISSIINPYFYHNDDYKPKKSSEESNLEEEIFEEIKSSLSSSSQKSNKSKDSKKDDKIEEDKMKEGFFGKLFNMFGF